MSNETRSLLNSSTSTDFDFYLWTIGGPIIFFPGIIGNVLTIIVILRPAFRHTTTGVYLPLIAFADGIVLLSGLIPDWLEWIGIFNLKEYSVWACRFHKFIFYTAGDVSIWLIVAFTFDRFVAVCFPLSKRTVCAPRRAIYASIATSIVFSLKNFHEFWTRGYQNTKYGPSNCGLPDEYFKFHAYVRPWLAFTTITALPFILILIFNCLIVHSLVQAQRMRALHAAGAAAQNSDGRKVATASSYKQTTLMCLSVSFAFLACILPSIILLIGKIHWNNPSAEPSTRQAYKTAKAVNNILVYVNHSINFILYCLTGRKFRDELKAMFQTCSGSRSNDNRKSKPEPLVISATGNGQTKSHESGLVTATTDICGQDSDD